MSSHALIQFRLPSGASCPLERAIVYNSHLTWRQSLPRHVHLWASLDQSQVIGIARLARGLRKTELTLQRRDRLKRSPWKVLQWWNPRQPDWASGRRALIIPALHKPEAVLQALSDSGLRAAIRQGCLEVLIPRRLSRRPAS